ncbi:MAG: radical SAM protein [Elusimicrobia bacterium]|nr:radical SAM protein [Elusimicrobiota bacterium]
MKGWDADLRLVFWETTAGCNLRCIHCRRLDVLDTISQGDLTTAEGKELIEGIRRVGSPILVLSGGEPLMRPDLFELATYAVEKGLTVSLATNGTLIDDPMAWRIRAAGIRRVAISIDGADASTHDAFRQQPGSLAKALEGFQCLKALGMSLQINCTITTHNVHQVEDLYALAVRLGVDALHVFMLVPVGCGMTIAETHMLPAETYEEILLWLWQKSQEGKLHVRATCAPHYFRIIRQQARRDGRPLGLSRDGFAAMTKGCLAGTAVCFVSHKGEVFPCGYLPVTAGNVRAQSFEGIWTGAPLFARFRDPGLLEGKCGICEFKHVCAGCRARAYSATGNCFAEEPYCIYQPLPRIC